MEASRPACSHCNTFSTETRLKEEHRLSIDIEVELVSKPKPGRSSEEKKKDKRRRDNATSEFCRKISALKNTGGGALFVHIRGLDPVDRNLYYLHELFDPPLNRLISDQSLFVDTYTFKWLDELIDKSKRNPQSHEFLVILVRGSGLLSTVDYKTKVSTDHEITQPSSYTVKQLLTREITDSDPKSQDTGSLKGESRSVQFKTCRDLFDVISSDNLQDIINYIWENLRLREYITSLSKNPTGGSFYLGIAEREKKHCEGYSSMVVDKTGVKITADLKEIEKKLEEKVKADIRCEPDSTRKIRINYTFHKLPQSYFILEVAVGSASGCVFYDQKGPEAYTLEGKESQRVEFSVWQDNLLTKYHLNYFPQQFCRQFVTMLDLFVCILVYIFLEILQRRGKYGKHRVSEVKELPSTFPFPPKLFQLDNGFQMIEQQTIRKRKNVILPETDKRADGIDAGIRNRLCGSVTSGIAVVTKSLVARMDLDKPSFAQPEEVIREVFFASCGRPAMTVCITSKESTKIKEYTLQLARKLTLRLRLFTDEHLSVLDGVIDVTKLESDYVFKESLNKIVEDGSRFCSPHSLLMGEKKMLNVQRAILAAVSTTVLDLSEMLNLEKKEQSGNQEILWILPQAVLQEESRLLDKSGIVTTTLKDEDYTLLVMDIARRWDKIQPTILCTRKQLNEKIRGKISQVICRDEIPDVKMQDNITQLVAETITQCEVKSLQEKMQKSGKYILVNPMEVQSNVTVSSVNDNWTPDLLDRFSLHFEQLRTFFEKEINSVYSCSFLRARYKGCRVLYFSKGSVRAHVKLYFCEREDENKSEHVLLIPPEDIGEAFKEGERERHQTPDCLYENPLQLKVVPRDHTISQTDTCIFRAPYGRKNIAMPDVLDDLHNHHYKKGIFKLKNASSEEIQDIVSEFRPLDVHDRDYGGNILYWTAVSGNRHLSKELMNCRQMTSEMLYDCLAFCILQNNSVAACLIISLYNELELQGTAVDFNFITENNRTLLTQAVDSKLYEVVSALLSAGADPQHTLYHVCNNGDEKGLKILLNPSHQVDINCRESFLWTPLMTTAYTGHKRLFEILLQHGSDLNVLDKLKRNVLHNACRGGNEAIIRSILQERSADQLINAKDELGYSSLMYALQHNNNDLYQLLVERNADVKAKDDDNNSMLHVAARDGSHHIVEKLLQQDPTGIDEKGQHGRTPAMVAAAFGQYEVFTILKEDGAKMNEQFDDYKYSFLHLGCQGGNLDIVKELLPLYSTKVQEENGKTPVEIAEDKPEVVEYIREWEKQSLP